MAENIDLCLYRTEKVLKTGLLENKFSILRNTYKGQFFELLLKKALNGEKLLVVSSKPDNIFTKDFMAYILQNNVLEKTLNIYKILYSSSLLVVQYYPRIWQQVEKILSSRKLDSIMFCDYNNIKGNEEKIEDLQDRFGFQFVAFIGGKEL